MNDTIQTLWCHRILFLLLWLAFFAIGVLAGTPKDAEGWLFNLCVTGLLAVGATVISVEVHRKKET